MRAAEVCRRVAKMFYFLNLLINIISMGSHFLEQFYSLQIPLPNHSYPIYPHIKSDLKLILEIATGSRLKQGQDKKN